MSHDRGAAPAVGPLLGPLPRIGTAVLGVVAYLLGWQLGWIELMVLAAACLLVLALAVPFVVGRSPDLTRAVTHAG